MGRIKRATPKYKVPKFAKGATQRNRQSAMEVIDNFGARGATRRVVGKTVGKAVKTGLSAANKRFKLYEAEARKEARQRLRAKGIKRKKR